MTDRLRLLAERALASRPANPRSSPGLAMSARLGVALLLAVASLGCQTGVGRGSTVGGTHVARCEPRGQDTREAVLTVQATGHTGAPLSRDMALAQWPVGTKLCVRRVDGGRFVRLRVVGQPADEESQVLVSAEAARWLGIQDRATVRVELTASAVPGA